MQNFCIINKLIIIYYTIDFQRYKHTICSCKINENMFKKSFVELKLKIVYIYENIYERNLIGIYNIIINGILFLNKIVKNKFQFPVLRKLKNAQL